jgi:hypothetical protein
MDFTDGWRYWKSAVIEAGRHTLTHARRKILTGLILSILAAILQFALDVRGLSDSAKIAISLLGSAVLVMVFSFLKNLISVPPSIDERQEAKLHALRAQLAAEIERPKRDPAEEYHIQLAEEGLENIGPAGVPLLRHLMIHGTLRFGRHDPPLPEGLNVRDLHALLRVAVNCQLVTNRHHDQPGGGEESFEIAPGMAAALRQVLYGSEAQRGSLSS